MAFKLVSTPAFMEDRTYDRQNIFRIIHLNYMHVLVAHEVSDIPDCVLCYNSH